MEEKSHVSLEQHACLVCGVSFGTGSILLDKCLRATMKRCTGMGWGLCPEHQKLSDDGLVALIECDLQRSGSPSGVVASTSLCSSGDGKPFATSSSTSSTPSPETGLMGMSG